MKMVWTAKLPKTHQDSENDFEVRFSDDVNDLKLSLHDSVFNWL